MHVCQLLIYYINKTDLLFFSEFYDGLKTAGRRINWSDGPAPCQNERGGGIDTHVQKPYLFKIFANDIMFVRWW